MTLVDEVRSRILEAIDTMTDEEWEAFAETLHHAVRERGILRGHIAETTLTGLHAWASRLGVELRLAQPGHVQVPADVASRVTWYLEATVEIERNEQMDEDARTLRAALVAVPAKEDS